jgi:hypothetical protein
MLVLALGTIVLHSVDISFIYHWIRGQAIIKLYVVFNVLEVRLPSDPFLEKSLSWQHGRERGSPAKREGL